MWPTDDSIYCPDRHTVHFCLQVILQELRTNVPQKQMGVIQKGFIQGIPSDCRESLLRDLEMKSNTPVKHVMCQRSHSTVTLHLHPPTQFTGPNHSFQTLLISGHSAKHPLHTPRIYTQIVIYNWEKNAANSYFLFQAFVVFSADYNPMQLFQNSLK